MMDLNHIRLITHEVFEEAKRAAELHAPMHGAHEGYAVLLEEVEELWDEVKKNPRKDPSVLAARRTEAIHVAAMAIRFIHDVCDTTQHSISGAGVTFDEALARGKSL